MSKPVHWAVHLAPWLYTEKNKPDHTARYVLTVLAEHADADGTNAYPSVLKIHYCTGQDEATIRRALRRLEDAELIRDVGPSPFGTTNYTLNLAMVRPASEWEAMKLAADIAKEAEAARGRARRAAAKAKASASSTQSPGRIDDEREDAAAKTADRPALSVWTGPNVQDSAFGRPDGTRPDLPPYTTPVKNTPPPGGTLPPDPLRLPVASLPGPSVDNSPSDVPTQLLPVITQLTDRAYASAPARGVASVPVPSLRLIEGQGAEEPATSPRGLFPMGLPGDDLVAEAHASWGEQLDDRPTREQSRASAAAEAARAAARAAAAQTSGEWPAAAGDAR